LLGADHVIDYTKVDPRHTGDRFDWIVDVDAHNSVLSWRKSLNPKGVYMAMGGSATWLLSLPVQMAAARLATDKSMGLMMAWKPFNPDDVATLEGMVAAGTVRPVIDRTFQLDEIVDALRYVESGKPRGKVMIEP
jgi:NADPH:quinone reductase-like Zn-dependent oxidoreductase